MVNFSNPLLDFTGLPRFDEILPEHVKPAIEYLLTENRTLVKRLSESERPARWDDFVAPLTDALEFLGRAWGVVGHLHAVNDMPAWRDAYNALLPEVSRFYAELGQNLALFEKYKAIRENAEYGHLNRARRRIVDNAIRDFRLSGAELPPEHKQRFQAIQEELASLSAKFSENLLDATNAYTTVITDEAALAGLPDEVKAAARISAQNASVAGWRFTLHAPSYLPVMQYAEDRSLREDMYRAYATRASEFAEPSGNPEWDNGPVMQKILQLRAEEAQMLGFSNFAEVSLVPKMADSPQQVLTFLRDLAAKAKPFAQKDWAELQQFAAEKLYLKGLEPWDIPFASENLLKERYDFSAQEVRKYFTEPKVIGGLFNLIGRLFNVRIKPDTAPLWHEEVRFFRIESMNGDLVGQLYMDLYARETKRGGAWMDEARTRRRVAQHIQTPVAYLNCNFSHPVGERNGQPLPATFTFDEVTTLFHEMGHVLHHLLTRAEELGVSGINGVEWDAVELPSQFMENYCWEWEVLEPMTAHVETGEPLPRALFDRMLAARNFQSGLIMIRQLEFSLFDMLLHSQYDPQGSQSIMDVLNQVRQEVAVIFPPDWHRFPNSFAHIFGGGYAAGYFSYKWAEVLSADAYAAFEETGNSLDVATGKRFLDEILSIGGERPALESFIAFRGRVPEVDALLRHNGMIAA